MWRVWRGVLGQRGQRARAGGLREPGAARYLTRLMVAAKFDLGSSSASSRTRAYARQSGTRRPAPGFCRAGDVTYERRAGVDSIMALSVPDPMRRSALPRRTRASRRSWRRCRTPTRSSKPCARRQRTADDGSRHAPPHAAEAAAAGSRRRSRRLADAARVRIAAARAGSHFCAPRPVEPRSCGRGWRSGTVPQTLVMLNSTLFDVLVKGCRAGGGDNRESGDIRRLRAVIFPSRPRATSKTCA